MDWDEVLGELKDTAHTLYQKWKRFRVESNHWLYHLYDLDFGRKICEYCGKPYNKAFFIPKEDIKAYMARVREDCRDPRTGQVNTTQLAQYAAIDLRRPEWLEYEDHAVWEAAEEVARDSDM
jgi:hypothetical protein